MGSISVTESPAPLASSADSPLPAGARLLTDLTPRHDGALERAAALHGQCFISDPILNYLCSNLPSVKRKAYIPQVIYALAKAGALNGATFDEIWLPGAQSSNKDGGLEHLATSGIWLYPYKSPDNPLTYVQAGMLGILWNIGIGGIRRMLGGYQANSDKAKKRHLADPDPKGKLVGYYYLWMISTAPEDRRMGLSAFLVRRFQEKVRAEDPGRKIWLEATTESSMRVYTRCGFKTVETWVLGKGEVDSAGSPKQGGDGVRVWGMLWASDAST